VARRSANERLQLVERLGSEIEALVSRGVSYAKARARVLGNHPEFRGNPGTMLDEAERNVRAARAERANIARSESKRQFHERRREAENLARRAAGLEARQTVYAYNPRGTPPPPSAFATFPVHFYNPAADRQEFLPVRLPIDPDQSNAAIAARLAAAISAHLDISYEDDPAEVYQSILEGIESGRIQGFTDDGERIR
jgi:hypothetical protein